MLVAAALISCGAKDPVLVDSDTLRVTLLSKGGANVYIVNRNDKRIMIDSGNPGDELVFETMMQEQGISPDSIDYLINPDPSVVEANPLYAAQNRDEEHIRGRVLGSIGVRWRPTKL